MFEIQIDGRHPPPIVRSTVGTLEAKVESLATTNALMKEDLDMSKMSLSRTQEENKQLLTQLEAGLKSKSEAEVEGQAAKSSKEGEETLPDVIVEREALRRELSLQMSMKAEMEMAMKLLEQDVNDKQETIRTLREQLEDIKQINMEMYSKLEVSGKATLLSRTSAHGRCSLFSLQECEADITEKGELVAKLENRTKDISKLLERLSSSNNSNH